MANGKAFQLWIVNVFSFILFAVLGLTGLINWLILPRGREAASGFLVSLRHFFCEVHEWTALGFMVLMAVHLYLHWNYIRINLVKYGIVKGGN